MVGFLNQNNSTIFIAYRKIMSRIGKMLFVGATGSGQREVCSLVCRALIRVL
jgi:hypothetical protein